MINPGIIETLIGKALKRHQALIYPCLDFVAFNKKSVDIINNKWYLWYNTADHSTHCVTMEVS